MGNGLGPWWFPAWLRAALTAWAARLFPSLFWGLHDAAYAEGKVPRWVCDRGALRAMLCDALAAESVGRMFALMAVAWFFWVLLRLFGHWSYNWGQNENST